MSETLYTLVLCFPLESIFSPTSNLAIDQVLGPSNKNKQLSKGFN